MPLEKYNKPAHHTADMSGTQTTQKVRAEYWFECIKCGKSFGYYLQSAVIEGKHGDRIEFASLNTESDLTCVPCKEAKFK